ncbi:hypothetical protein HDV63DRAFT_303571 [Trichoderma sp. SZMC 28014]
MAGSFLFLLSSPLLSLRIPQRPAICKVLQALHCASICSRWWHRSRWTQKSPATSSGGVRPVSSRFFTGIPSGMECF